MYPVQLPSPPKVRTAAQSESAIPAANLTFIGSPPEIQLHLRSPVRVPLRVSQLLSTCPAAVLDVRIALHRQRKREDSLDPPFSLMFFGDRSCRSTRVLLAGGVAGGSCPAGGLRRRQIPGDLVLVHIEYHDFIRRGVRGALHVELDRFARRLILLLDGLVVGQNRDRIFRLLLVRLVQGD